MHSTFAVIDLGYGRVSTRDQNPDAQRDRLTAAGCDRVYVDTISGTLSSRPEFDKVLDTLRAGDVLVFTKLDRLGRSVKMLKQIADRVQGTGAGLRALDQNIDTTTPEGRLFLHILAAFAEWERDLISARTLDGLEAARARGRSGGRKRKLKVYQVERARQMYEQTSADGKRTYTVQQIADEIGVKRTTLNGYLRTTPPKSTHD
ncbi:recombinase family protein [Streptosporangium canum]|uniref:recombinase family protein n=1 Tax=Streptosporangium canum TaxID=324952 RepID=UPI00343EF6C1